MRTLEFVIIDYNTNYVFASITEASVWREHSIGPIPTKTRKQKHSSHTTTTTNNSDGDTVQQSKHRIVQRRSIHRLARHLLATLISIGHLQQRKHIGGGRDLFFFLGNNGNKDEHTNDARDTLQRDYILRRQSQERQERTNKRGLFEINIESVFLFEIKKGRRR